MLERRQYRLGKYDIVAQPATGSMHMLRYTVFVDGKRVGALLSVPTESDCSFLEAPPKVPPLKVFSVTFRRARPRKGPPARAGYAQATRPPIPPLTKGNPSQPPTPPHP